MILNASISYLPKSRGKNYFYISSIICIMLYTFKSIEDVKKWYKMVISLNFRRRKKMNKKIDHPSVEYNVVL